MVDLDAIGITKLTPVDIENQAKGKILKADDVQLALARTICSGKFVIIVAENVTAVEEAMSVGLDAAPNGVIDHSTVPNVRGDVFKALGQPAKLSTSGQRLSIGVVETFSAAEVVRAKGLIVYAVVIPSPSRQFLAEHV